MFSLKGKNILVFGGAGYLATPISKSIVEAGANLIIADFAETRAQALAKELQTQAPDSKIIATGAVNIDNSASIIYLLSSESSYVTGQNIAVNGGWNIW